MISVKRITIILVSFLLIYVALHLPGVYGSYHQDEYKWVYLTYKSDIETPGNIPHPPLAELSFILFGPTLGAENYRFIPFAFGIIDLFLIFYLAKIIFGTRTALWTVFLSVITFYALLASLMVDVDGTIMPMFFMIMAIAYYKLRVKNFEIKGNWPYVVLLVIGAVGSFLVKLSGILPVMALALDFAIEKGIFKDAKKVVRYALVGLGSVVILGLLVYLSRFLFPYFSIDKSITYWKTFGSASFLDRGWFQTFIQFGKSVLYASPLLVVPALFIDKDIWAKTRPLFLFVFIGLTFYLVMFDFSIGALDRYFQYLIVPFCIVSAAVFTKHFGASVQNEEQKKSNIFIPIIASAVIFFLQFVPHYIPPLHPKALWLSKMLSLKWNFLFPFTGGSGPLPFYVSFLFISCVWAICLLIFIYSIRRPNFKKQALVYVFVLGIVYNAVFIEEYLFGLINGSAQKLVNDSVAYIVQNKDIKEVMVYNDNGGFEMHESGKYSRRIYAAPQFVDTYKPIFDKYSGHILFIDIPRLSDDSMYKQYFDSCKIIYNESSKQISSKIYDCAK